MSLIDDAKDLAKQAGSKVADTARDIKDKATDKASDLVDKAGDALDGMDGIPIKYGFLLCCIYCSDIRNPQGKEPELEPGTKCNRSISVDWPTAWIDRLRCQTLFCVSATIVAGSKCRNRLR